MDHVMIYYYYDYYKGVCGAL